MSRFLEITLTLTVFLLLLVHLQASPTGVVEVGEDVGSDSERERLWRRREVYKNITDENGKYFGPYDPECYENLRLTPSIKIVDIEPDKNILKLGGTTCHWNVIGFEDCIPVITCKEFSLMEATKDANDEYEDSPALCEDDFLEVTDGSHGYQKYCGDEGPVDVTSGRKARDLYITLKLADYKQERDLQCSVHCSRGSITENNLNEDSDPEVDEDSDPEVDEDCNCGRKPSGVNGVVGGQDIKKTEFPWMAALVTAGTRSPYCGGSVINNKFILTSAHCLKEPYNKADDIEILLNAHFLDVPTNSDEKYTEDQLLVLDVKDDSHRYRVDKYYIHPLHSSLTNDFDVALIQLEQSIRVHDIKEISPICIPRLGVWAESKEGVKAVASGFTYNKSLENNTVSILQKSEVSISTNAECERFYPVVYTKRMICAENKQNDTSTCKGGAGGPLISEKSKQVWEQIGISGFAEKCGEEIIPGSYTNTREVAQWIRYISNLEVATWCYGN